MKEFLKKARRAEWLRDYSTAGDFYRLGGEPLKALKAYQKGGLHAQAASLQAELGDYAASAESYSRAGDARSSGEMWLKAEEPEKAWRMYRRAGDLRQAAEILEKMGKPLEAAGLYEQAGLKEPAARLYASHGRPADAVRLLERLIAETEADSLHLESADRAQRVRRYAEACGKLHARAGNFKAAAPFLERAGLLEEAARAYRESGQNARAVEALMKAGLEQEAASLVEGREAGEFDPRVLAELALKRGENERAAEHFLRAGEPGMAAECFERGGLALKAAEAARAARDLLGAARLYRSAGEWRQAAGLYREANAPAEAADCLERAGDAPAAAECYLAGGEFLKAARILFGRGELDRCIEVLQKIPRDAGDAEEGSVLLGQIFEEKALFSLAADCYRRALGGRGAEPDTLPVLYRLGRVLEKCGRVEEARHLYERIAAVDFRFQDVASRVAALSPGGRAPAAAGAEGSPARALPLRPLDGRYEKTAGLGRGRGGPLFLGRERSSLRAVRIIRIALDPERDAAKAARLLDEAQRLSGLRHPGIVPLLDAGADANGLYYVHEHREGKTLGEVLREGGLPDFGTVVSLLSRLAEALDYAHGQGALCRNLRPDTVLITPQREVMILDFGLALRLTEPSGSAEDEAALRYAPPELLLRERLDVRSDLYSLGLVGLEACVGAAGARAAGPGEAAAFPDPAPRPVPALVRRVVERCLERDRNRRYPAARDLLADLQGAQLLPGAIVASRYEVVREAGRGGMGEVYEARDLVLDERVALKIVSGSLDDASQKRFLNEIKLARRITHPNVVRVFTFEQWRDLRFIVMEYIEGQGLAHWLRRRGLPPVEEGARIACALADGIARAHAAGIVHRDLKPENILIDAAGQPRILDFGIARLADTGLTQAGMTIGSPKYMSPEQVEGKTVDARSDLYSLGLVLYLLFTGKEAFEGPDARSILIQQLQKTPPAPRSLRTDLPPALDGVLLRLLAKEPEARPRSASDLAALLAPFATAPAPAR